MYGVLLQSVKVNFLYNNKFSNTNKIIKIIKEAIIKHFGKAIWSQIEQFVDLDLDAILIKKIYPDSAFDEIIKCLMMLRQTGDTEIYMELFGKIFRPLINALRF